MNRWIKDAAMPEGASLLQIAMALDVSMDYLTGKTDAMEGFSAPRPLDAAERKALSALDAPDPLAAMELFIEALREYHQKPSDFTRRRMRGKAMEDDE